MTVTEQRRSGGAPATHLGSVTKVGFLVIAAGVVLIFLRAANWVDSELADIASVLAIVVGALMVAIDGEEADESTKPRRRGD